jgi:hypothetical protein
MEVCYCDLCLHPIKPGEGTVLFKKKETYSSYNYNQQGGKITAEEAYSAMVEKVAKGIKMICPVCDEIINKIFEYRMQNLNKITNEMLGIIKLPTKESPFEKKVKANRKKKGKK